MKKRKEEFIRASGTQGLKKSAIRVTVESPNEKVKQVLFGEVANIRPDMRRRRKHNYVTLFTLGKHGRNKITYDVLKGSMSLTTALGFHYDFSVLDDMDLSKFLACILIHDAIQKIGHFPIDISIRELSNKLEMSTRLFMHEFVLKIKKARTAYKLHLKAKHRKG